MPFILARLYWRGFKAPDYRRRWAERFGFFAALPKPGCIWIHAVSVGETRAALPLIRALQSLYPQRPLLITTTTPTGSRQVREAFQESVHHVYVPYDLPDAVKRFLNRTRPGLAIIMETELWPNLFRNCSLREIPLVIANARLSERSASGYKRLHRLTAQTLAHTTLIAAQGEADALRFRALGAPRVEFTGNIKYDLDLPAGLMEQSRSLRRSLGEQRPIWIAASTHAGEEQTILEVFSTLRHRWPDLLLLLVPRHPERFLPVKALCQRHRLQVITRSEERPCDTQTAVFLGDSMGELLLFYSVADLAFVGGSLVSTGGHNILEPALLGVPVLFGPYMFNFAEISQRLLQAGAAWQIANAKELTERTELLLADPLLRETAGQRGQALVEANRGALAALLENIQKMLDREG
jgi:3-deoxy-D-manno-octulosonic-acid transferase